MCQWNRCDYYVDIRCNSCDNPVNLAVLNEDPISFLKLCAQEHARLLFAIPKEKKKLIFLLLL